jgi:glycosyltransferase involved in cell wall biosynthesis
MPQTRLVNPQSTNGAAPAGRIRVVRVIDRLNVGGPAQHVVWLAAGLNPGRYETTLVAGTVAAGEGDMGYFARERGVEPVIIEQMSRELGIRDVVAMVRLLRLLFRVRPDVVHTHKAKAGAVGRSAAFLYRWLTPAALIGRPRRCRVVHTFHGHVFHGYYGRAKSALFVLIERVLARLTTDIIVVVSEEQRREINGRYHVGRPEQFRVIPLGMEPQPGAGGREDRPWRGGPGEFVIGAVGRLCEVKNQPMLFEILDELGRSGVDSRLVLVGDGHLREALEAESRRLGVYDRTVFLGFREDVRQLYRTFDVVALTSVNEGTPLTLIEALFAGVPVVATEVGGVPSIMGRRREAIDGFSVWDHGITVPSRDAAAAVRGLCWLRDHAAERRSMGERGRAFAQARYSVNRLLADVDALYRVLAGSRDPEPLEARAGARLP